MYGANDLSEVSCAKVRMIETTVRLGQLAAGADADSFATGADTGIRGEKDSRHRVPGRTRRCGAGGK
ncbi:MAG: hypothetical protein DWQ08_12315 [Proteobacteria bacterium]|nr:MAG: hypothetical protein DWQ08_12315 [Pseudomonadota bacterium]